MKKSCLNCMLMVPKFDGVRIAHRECMVNEGMRVNARMHCEEWKSDDITPRIAQEIIQM